ncbi:Hint domain-containing protein [Herbaspirillum rhizosphaerae]|uniref:Hint domain-containing protein n=1 Tax=Herbaspirillum rhizosphaerae TaxID=346179 RepID=A0ABW8Z3Q6_9BURK
MESNSQDALPGISKDLSCVASGTLIATPDGQKDSVKFNLGDAVMTASVSSTGGKLTLQWSNAEIGFHHDLLPTASHRDRLLVEIELERTKLRCTLDQWLLLPNGEWTTAGLLRPDMQLVDKDGASLAISSIEKGYFKDGIQSIMTNRPWNGSPDGHILLANGIVIGDFAMQVYS